MEVFFELLDPLRKWSRFGSFGYSTEIGEVALVPDEGSSSGEILACPDFLSAPRDAECKPVLESAGLGPDSLAFVTGEAQGRSLERKLR